LRTGDQLFFGSFGNSDGHRQITCDGACFGMKIP
jgi:hypothetical protein